MEWLGQRTCLLKNLISPASFTPKKLCQLTISPICGHTFSQPLFITDPCNSYTSASVIGKKLYLILICISLLLWKLSYIFFHVLYVYWVFLFLLWITHPYLFIFFLLGSLSFLKLICRSTVYIIYVNPLLYMFKISLPVCLLYFPLFYGVLDLYVCSKICQSFPLWLHHLMFCLGFHTHRYYSVYFHKPS